MRRERQKRTKDQNQVGKDHKRSQHRRNNLEKEAIKQLAVSHNLSSTMWSITELMDCMYMYHYIIIQNFRWIVCGMAGNWSSCTLCTELPQTLSSVTRSQDACFGMQHISNLRVSCYNIVRSRHLLVRNAFSLQSICKIVSGERSIMLLS